MGSKTSRSCGGKQAQHSPGSLQPSPTRNDVRADDSKEPLIRVFALTGGPCAGKTTAIVKVADRFRSLGYEVYIVPEIATLYDSSGASFPVGRPDVVVEWEVNRIWTQINLEDSFVRLAKRSQRPSIVVCDRGCIDSKAYHDKDEWKRIINGVSVSEVNMRDSRYDAVVHMVTAAEGALEFYTKSNNKARRESPEEAKAVDKRTKEAWLGHPKFAIVGNDGDFANKLANTINFFYSCTHEQLAVGSKDVVQRRKFFVEGIDDDKWDPNVAVSNCELVSTFLARLNPKEQTVVRKRGQDDCFYYSVSTAEFTSNQKITRQRPIDEATYSLLLAEADTALKPVKRNRRCFIWRQHYFELDHDATKDQSTSILIVEAGQNAVIDFPPWITVGDELTDKETLLALANGNSPKAAKSSV